MKSLNELIAKAFEQFSSLETVIRPFTCYTLHVAIEVVQAILVGRMLSDKYTHIVLFLENRKEEILEGFLLMPSKPSKGAQAIAGEISFIAWPDAGSVVVDGIERTNENVGEDLGLEAVGG